jgi:thioredoxin-like negative regulator of GroEL
VSTAEAVYSPPPRPSRPRLVFFYAEACGRCRRVEGFIAQVLQRRANHETFVLHRVEVEERADLHLRFGIDVVPTLVVVADNRVQGRLQEPQGCKEITRFLAPWLQ